MMSANVTHSSFQLTLVPLYLQLNLSEGKLISTISAIWSRGAYLENFWKMAQNLHICRPPWLAYKENFGLKDG